VCYCTPEELEERRTTAKARGAPPGYDGRCRNLSEEERAAFEAEGRPGALRFAMPGHDVTFTDIIRGETHFPASDLKDFVILRSDGTPVYLLAAAVDDLKMEMTHVIRGEDLLSSTPRQMAIFEALGAKPPEYAHLPLIVGPDRQPLSKRHGAVAVETFRDRGILPEAMLNYLALLGWSPGEEEILPREELVGRFELGAVQHHPAAFDPQKLEWMNGHYIRMRSDEQLGEELAGRLGVSGEMRAQVIRAASLVKERMKTLAEAEDLLRFLDEDVEPNEKARKEIEKAGPEHLEEAASRLEAVEEWTTPELTKALEQFAADRGQSKSKAWQPIRAAVTGSTVSPPLPESLALLGRDRTLERLRRSAGT
jgi:glutamyl-tRNA synthetase